MQLGDPASRADLERVRFIGWPEALIPHSDDLPTWIRKGDIVLIPRTTGGYSRGKVLNVCVNRLKVRTAYRHLEYRLQVCLVIFNVVACMIQLSGEMLPEW